MSVFGQFLFQRCLPKLLCKMSSYHFAEVTHTHQPVGSDRRSQLGPNTSLPSPRFLTHHAGGRFHLLSPILPITITRWVSTSSVHLFWNMLIEILELMEMIYLIENAPWLCLLYCVPLVIVIFFIYSHDQRSTVQYHSENLSYCPDQLCL